MQGLKSLRLSNNKFKQLPPDIGRLACLESLALDGNDLGEIPPQIGNLTQPKDLDLDSNEHLKTLPKEIGQLQALERLDLEDTGIESLPDEVKRLATLKRLDIRGTPMADDLEQENAVKSIQSALPGCTVVTEGVSVKKNVIEGATGVVALVGGPILYAILFFVIGGPMALFSKWTLFGREARSVKKQIPISDAV